MTIFGRRPIVLASVPSGWRWSEHHVLLTPAELEQFLRGEIPFRPPG